MSANPNKFSTFSQFDQKFKLSEFGGECNACPIFALFTAKKFMDNGSITQEQHEKNLEAAVMNYIISEGSKELPKYMSFFELIQFAGGEFTDNEIKGTLPQIINEFGYGEIFKPEEYNGNYACIFLKNSNFIVVLVKKNDDGSTLFCVRDCHESEQYNLESLAVLQVHLNTKYQFNQLTVVDGYLIEEFANIEYLIVDKSFPLINVDPTLYDDENKKEDDGIDMYINMDTLSAGELKDLGLYNPKDDLEDGLDKMLKDDSKENVDNVDNQANSGDALTLDEMIAMQLQYGEDF